MAHEHVGKHAAELLLAGCVHCAGTTDSETTQSSQSVKVWNVEVTGEAAQYYRGG